MYVLHLNNGDILVAMYPHIVDVATLGVRASEEVLAATCVTPSAHCGKISFATRKSLHVKYQKFLFLFVPWYISQSGSWIGKLSMSYEFY